eukprot:TRINITY_DN10256_c0_g1_i2.p1 TRINITY_DN10256_c0_g1~~TRINITY_DN10256_c0_g1_i2.p1  ORF type:complete len:722 (+),score=226.24 TRINITY_DN10256_c0_g1_i2:149-2314(+)
MCIRDRYQRRVRGNLGGSMYEHFSDEDDDTEEWGDEFKHSNHSGGAKGKPLKWALKVQVVGGLGDRVLLPSACLEALSSGQEQQQGPMTFRLSTTKRKTHCGVREFTSEEGVICVPEALAESLGLTPGDRLLVAHCTLPRATSCVLQPLHCEFFGIADHKAALESLLRQQYVTLTEGDCIRMPWSGSNALKRTSSSSEAAPRVPVYELGVVSLKPAKAVCIIDCDMEVEIAPLEGGSDAFRHAMVPVGGAPVPGAVPAGEYEYYEVPIDETLDSVDIELTVLSGDADLFGSAADRFPCRTAHTWREVEVGNVQLRVTRHDPRLIWANTPVLYVGVRGYAPHSSFSIQARRTAPSGMQAAAGAPKRKRVALAAHVPVAAGMARCEHCMQDVSESALMLHAAQCSRNNWVCDVCRCVLPLHEQDSHQHCPHCPLVHPSEEALAKHVSMLHDELSCACGATASMDLLGQHKLTACPLRHVLCRFCGSMFEAGDVPEDHRDRLNGLTSHESVCGGRTDSCTVCGQYVRMKEMDAHMAMHSFLAQPSTAQPAPAEMAAPQPAAQLPPPVLCANSCGSMASPSAQSMDQWNFNGSPHNVLCVPCRAAVPSTEQAEPKGWAQKLVKVYFGQLTKGCGNHWCSRQHCATGTGVPVAPNEAVVRAVQLAKETGASAYHVCLAEQQQEAQDRVSNLVAMGFPQVWAAHALGIKEDSVDRAVLWLLEEGHGA